MYKKEWLQKFSYIMLDKLDEKKLKGYQLANRMGIPTNSFYNNIYGKSVPSAYTVRLMAKNLGCTTDELLMFDMDDEYVHVEKRNVVTLPENIPDRIPEDQWKKLFAQNLYNKMCECGYTQIELGRASGLGTTCIFRYLEGETIPNGWRLVNLARALECSVDALIDFGGMVINW